MKTLFLMRHAKSSWGEPGLPDFERPLNERGYQAAPFMGRLMRERQLLPHTVISSPARRARETAELVVNAAGLTLEVGAVAEIYEASTMTLAETVAAVDDRFTSAMIVGHNPGMENLVAYLTGDTVRMPTAALAVIEMQIDKWSETTNNRGRLAELIRPREVMPQ
jgi:phosphohistidine phosphatase